VQELWQQLLFIKHKEVNMNTMVLNAIPECDLIDITGGGFLDGAALVISSLSVAVKVVSIAAASTAAAPLSAGASSCIRCCFDNG
jgi:polysaccharide pyruvyl transferase WcaK-like protein